MAMALSSFDEALTLLLLAHRLLQVEEDAPGSGSKDAPRPDSPGARPGEEERREAQACCLHATGRTMRYLGRYAESSEALEAALSIRRGAAGETAGKDACMSPSAALPWRQAQEALTRRELGTTAAKQQMLPEARCHLNASLAITRSLPDPDPHEVAATLHQLAVVETQAAKGSREGLQLAESLLLEALELETGSLEKAALAMQLGRIGLRRGELVMAQDCFMRALAAYEALYGTRSARHVNTAAAQFNLGKVLLSRKELPEASKRFREALAIRKAAYGCDHFEICVTLGELAKVEHSLGQAHESKALYLEEKAMLEKLILQGSSGAPLAQARKELANTFYGLRSLARDAGERDQVKTLTHAAQALLRPPSETTPTTPGTESTTPTAAHETAAASAAGATPAPWVAAILRGRDRVRQAAVAMVKGGWTSYGDSGAEGSLPFLSAMDELEAAIPPLDVEAGGGVEAMPARVIAKAFAAQVRRGAIQLDSSSGGGRKEARLLLFAACDKLRSELRTGLGVNVEDTTGTNAAGNEAPDVGALR